MKKVRVLSLDGGGMRGVIPAMVLDYVEQRLQNLTGNATARIADYFDMIVGTSTGGILACFYLTPNDTDKNSSAKYTATEALKFYSEKGFDIFNKSKRKSWLGLRSLVDSAMYNPSVIERIFMDTFGDLRMSNLLKPCTVTTYDMRHKTTFFFSSIEAKDKKRDFFVRDVVRSTSAAPTYFPPAEITNLTTKEKMINIDGGVFANNPTMCAYAECRNTKFPQVDNPSAKEMLLLSIGTGGGQFDLPNVSKSGKWGVVNWAKSIPEIMMDGAVDTVHYQLKNLFATLEQEHQFNYKRIDVPLNKRRYSPDMADASPQNIEHLKQAGKATIEAAQEKRHNEYTLDEFIEQLIENAPEKELIS